MCISEQVSALRGELLEVKAVRMYKNRVKSNNKLCNSQKALKM